MSRRRFVAVLAGLFLAAVAGAARGETLGIAAAADLRFALDEIVTAFRKDNPGDRIDVTYGSSGRFYAQIRQGAPFDLFFSADIAYPRELHAAGMAASAVTPYARGRLVVWSATLDAGRLDLRQLADPAIARVAIANPRHAPYGRRAEEALRRAGVWDKVEAKLIVAENVGQAAQFVLTGNAQVGIIALALALSPQLAGKGSYRTIPENLHEPLDQGFVITRRAAANPLARRFAAYLATPAAQAVLTRHGFVPPGAGSQAVVSRSGPSAFRASSRAPRAVPPSASSRCIRARRGWRRRSARGTGT